MASRIARCLALCLIVLIALGCGQDSDPGEQTVTATPGDVVDQPPYPGAVVINDALDPLERWGSDDYEIRNGGDHTPFIEEDTLTVTLSYGGGCEAHDITLVAYPSDVLPDSYPVHLDVVLAHDANGDACEAYLTDTYVFDLTPIRTRYRERYGDVPGTVILVLQGVPNDTPDLVYGFGW